MGKQSDGFDEILEEETEELIEGYQKTLTNKELLELEGSSAENKADEKQEEPATWNKFAEVF
jgi:hypothetical protein